MPSHPIGSIDDVAGTKRALGVVLIDLNPAQPRASLWVDLPEKRDAKKRVATARPARFTMEPWLVPIELRSGPAAMLWLPVLPVLSQPGAATAEQEASEGEGPTHSVRVEVVDDPGCNVRIAPVCHAGLGAPCFEGTRQCRVMAGDARWRVNVETRSSDARHAEDYLWVQVDAHEVDDGMDTPLWVARPS